MPTSTKPSGNSTFKKIGERAVELHPDIEWVIQKPTPEIEDDYGKGFVLSGRLGDKGATYFILNEDPRKDNWIHMIASQLRGDE